MIRSVALDETAESLRDAVHRRLAPEFAPPSSAPVDPMPAWAALAELGALSICLREEAGGLGTGVAAAALVLEPVGRLGIAVPCLDGLCGAAALAEAFPAHDALLSALSDAAGGGAPVPLAWTEPCRGWERVPETTIAEPMPGGEYRLSGRKVAVRWADRSDAIVVSAACMGATGLFLVPTDAPGVRRAPCATADGQSAADLDFDGVVLASSARLDEGAGQSALEFALDALAALSLAEAVGAMTSCLELTLEHLRNRTQFGAQLSSFQALQHRLVEAYADCETAWSMTLDALDALRADVDEITRAMRVSAAKAHVGPRARHVAQEALQLHGATGMTLDYPLGRRVARLTLIDLGYGDSDWHLDRLLRLGEDLT
ncbi:acyl-CoA dehydrogenase family protein [Roseibacterium sp. SDUM158016]|uniref:acyl-CoA dehydrogenase family protein n=1 Tax=Roseicyclus sediminis TaxID=2980997 RepID=UPI0021CF6B5F|nr:acyl-CoA dehydrogenase family protein [Roseibacterium sp. SDUM158016]MCU4655001.1 acyl-CoA dehydrogenase family protein [Roseibacterium sp. SDUM158016]